MKALPALGGKRARTCGCGSSLENTIMTDPAAMPSATRKKLGPLVDKYLG
jgi:hypothetical protein